MPKTDLEKAQRLIEQLAPVAQALERLRSTYRATQKEPSGHPNLHPLRASVKQLEAALSLAVGQIAQARRQDAEARNRRQSRNRPARGQDSSPN